MKKSVKFLYLLKQIYIFLTLIWMKKLLNKTEELDNTPKSETVAPTDLEEENPSPAPAPTKIAPGSPATPKPPATTTGPIGGTTPASAPMKVFPGSPANASGPTGAPTLPANVNLDTSSNRVQCLRSMIKWSEESLNLPIFGIIL